MAGHLQRFRAHQSYLADKSEDILATTLFLPATITLLFANGIGDQLTTQNVYVAKLGKLFWNAARLILLTPLYFTKGLAHLTVIPLFALGLTLAGKTPKKSNFSISDELMQSGHGNLIQLGLIADVLIGLFALTLYMPGPILLLLNKLPLNGLVFAGLGAFPFYGLLAAVLFSHTAAIGLLTASIISAVTLEGKTGIFGHGLNKLLERISTVGQKWLHAFKFKVFQNDKNHITFEDIDTLPFEQLFVTDSNHALDLASLEESAPHLGLANFELLDDRHQHPRLSEKEVARLEQHPQLEQKFPQLARYITEHKDEYQANQQRISAASIERLKQLAESLQRSEDAADFAENLQMAKEAYENHVASLSAAEKTALRTLNLRGGTDSEFELGNVLTKTFENRWCKKNAATSILHACSRLTSGINPEDSVEVPFWHQDHPVHFVTTLRGRTTY